MDKQTLIDLNNKAVEAAQLFNTALMQAIREQGPDGVIFKHYQPMASLFQAKEKGSRQHLHQKSQ